MRLVALIILWSALAGSRVSSQLGGRRAPPPTKIYDGVQVSSEELRYGITMWALRGPPQDAGGQLESFIYDPTAGYEPYWINGHWVFEGEKVTTTQGPNCPYAECPPPFVQYGPVCGIDKNDRLASFNTYCDLLLADCYYDKQLSIAYRGACKLEEVPVFYYHNFTGWAWYDKVLEGGQTHIDSANKHILAWYASSPTTVTYTPYSTFKDKLDFQSTKK